MLAGMRAHPSAFGGSPWDGGEGRPLLDLLAALMKHKSLVADPEA